MFLKRPPWNYKNLAVEIRKITKSRWYLGSWVRNAKHTPRANLNVAFKKADMGKFLARYQNGPEIYFEKSQKSIFYQGIGGLEAVLISFY